MICQFSCVGYVSTVEAIVHKVYGSHEERVCDETC